MKNPKLFVAFIVVFCFSNMSITFTNNVYGGWFSKSFYRSNGLVNGKKEYRDIHQDPEGTRVTRNSRTLKRNTFDEPQLATRSNFYRANGLVNGDPKYRDRHLTVEDQQVNVYSSGGLVRGKVSAGYATNRRLKRAGGGFFDMFRPRPKSSAGTRQTIVSPR